MRTTCLPCQRHRMPQNMERQVTASTDDAMRDDNNTTGAGMPSVARTPERQPGGTRGRRAFRGVRRAALAAGLVLPFALVFDALAKDTTPPVVKLEVKQGAHFKAVKTATMTSGEPLTVRAVARDPQGVKSMTISFPPVTSSSCTVHDAVYTGSFPITLPPSKSVHATGLHTKLAKNVTIPYPTCQVLGAPSQTGNPIGHTFTVVLTARNRSSNSNTNHATTQLKVKLQ